MTDDTIRNALTPLRLHEPRPDLRALVRRGRHARAIDRRRHTAGAGVAVALAAGVALTGLPGGADSPLTARSVLQAAAAAAAEQPPEPLTGIRYVRLEYRIVLQPHGGTEQDRFQFTRDGEQWVRRDGTGRVEMGAGAFTDLQGRPHPGPAAGMPAVGAHASDERRVDFEHMDVANLPTEPDALERVLAAAMRRTFEERTGRVAESEVVPKLVTRAGIDLLSFASISREQRRAILEVLAGMPGARAIDEDEVEMQDSGLMLGTSIETRLVVDRDTGALVSRTERPGDEPYPGADRIEQSWTFTASRDVSAVGVRP